MSTNTTRVLLALIAITCGATAAPAAGLNAFQGTVLAYDGANGQQGSSVDYWYFTVPEIENDFDDDLPIVGGGGQLVPSDDYYCPDDYVLHYDLPPTQQVTIDTLSWERDSSDRHDNDGDTSEHVDVNGDGEIAYLDTYTYLFYDDGALDAADYIMQNDDSNATYADGSIFRYDSYLDATLPAGDYVLAIGAYHLSMDEALDRFNPSNSYPRGADGRSDHGDYQITFSPNVLVTGSLTGPMPIPEPATLGLAALAGIGGLARRRRR